MNDNDAVLLGSLRACVDSLIANGDDISVVQFNDIRDVYSRLLGVQQDVVRGGSLFVPKMMSVPVIAGLSSKLSMAARVILDGKARDRAKMGFILDKDRVEIRGFCLSCHLYTRNLDAGELVELLGYFVKNGYPRSYIAPPNEFGKRFIFLLEAV
jgi:hypothetical protein